MTKIEWTDATWNPIVGCSVTSPGCTNCYAMKMAGRLEGMAATNASLAHYVGTTQRSKAGFVWTGTVNMAPDSILTAPLRRRKPTRYFVNSMADLFHESVPDEWIDRVFAVMALAPQHTFQVLTKRSARMREYFRECNGWRARIAWLLNDLKPSPLWNGNVYQGWQNLHEQPDGLPNVWLGVSVEDQARADERIPDLLDTPAAVRFLSCEPLLGPVDLRAIPWPEHWPRCECLQGDPRYDAFEATVYCPSCCEGPEAMEAPTLDWVIAGGESGPGARGSCAEVEANMRLLLDQCRAAGVAFFGKQNFRKLPLPDDLLAQEFPA